MRQCGSTSVKFLKEHGESFKRDNWAIQSEHPPVFPSPWDMTVTYVLCMGSEKCIFLVRYRLVVRNEEAVQMSLSNRLRCFIILLEKGQLARESAHVLLWGHLSARVGWHLQNQRKKATLVVLNRSWLVCEEINADISTSSSVSLLHAGWYYVGVRNFLQIVQKTNMKYCIAVFFSR